MDTAMGALSEPMVDLRTTRRPAILIIGRSTDWRRRLEDRLHRAGCDVMTASNAKQGIDQAVAVGPDVVMLGHNLNDVDSLDICRRIRNRLEPDQAPAFFLAPNGDSTTSERAASTLDESTFAPAMSVDHGVEILLAGRSDTQPPPTTERERDVIRTGPLSLNAGRHHAELDGKDLDLTPTEFRMLWTLLQNPGHVFDRKQLTEICRIRGRTGQKRTVDVHIKSIRKKLGSRAEFIETVYGVGYRFRENDSCVQ